MSESHKKQLETQRWNIADTLRGKMGTDGNPAAKAAGYKMLDVSPATTTSRCRFPTAHIYHLLTPRFSGGMHGRGTHKYWVTSSINA